MKFALSILETIGEGWYRPNSLYFRNKISMGGALRSFSTGLLFCIWMVVGSATAHAQERPDSFADLAERLLPSVVNISTATLVKGGG